MIRLKDIQEISTDPSVQKRLREIGNHDSWIERREVDADRDGTLDRNTVTRRWTGCQFRQVEQALFRTGLLAKVRGATCGTADVVFKTEIDGDRKIGNVLYIRQAHHRPEANEFEQDLIFRWQSQIFKLLLERRPMHIFSEGAANELPPGRPVREAEVELLDGSRVSVADVKRIFPDKKIPDSPTPEQRDALIRLGADTIYAFLFDFVHIHPTATTEEMAESDGAGLSGRGVNHSAREAQATREVLNFLKEHPGEEVVLVYGAGHNFDDNFRGATNPPALTTTSFPHLVREASHLPVFSNLTYREAWGIGTSIREARVNPEIQTTVIERSRVIPNGAFGEIVTEKGQLIALTKLELDAERWKQVKGTELKPFLLKNARSEKVRREIRARFK